MTKRKRPVAGVNDERKPDVDRGFADDVTFADGTAVKLRRASAIAPTYFRVTILYREPEFEARIARREQPFRWTYRIAASTEDRAAASAISEFQAMARLSSVGWRRDIVSVEATPVDPEPDP